MNTVKLYKVLTADGHSPYITAYAWSLPTPNGDRTHTPGAWHEEPASVFDRGHGLHITPSPGHYVPQNDCTFYEVEADGFREDPLTNHHVVALRVRLMRPITRDEADRIMPIRSGPNASARSTGKFRACHASRGVPSP